MKNPTHILRAIRFLIMTGAGLVMIHFLVRVFVADRFIVNMVHLRQDCVHLADSLQRECATPKNVTAP